jgi:hypothetical protein
MMYGAEGYRFGDSARTKPMCLKRYRLRVSTGIRGMMDEERGLRLLGREKVSFKRELCDFSKKRNDEGGWDEQAPVQGAVRTSQAREESILRLGTTQHQKDGKGKARQIIHNPMP